LAVDGSEWSTSLLGCFTSRKEPWVSILYKAGCSGHFGGGKSLALAGIELQNVQPIA